MSTTPVSPEAQYQLDHESDNRSADIISSCTIMLVVAYVAVGLRVLARRLGKAGMGYDDWMMLAGLFWTTCYVVGCCVVVHFGMGRHAVLIKNTTGFAQAVLTTGVLYMPASTTIKLSILLLYRRLFPVKKLKIATICIACFIIVFAVTQILGVIIQCTPVAALWDPSEYPDAHCDDFSPALLLFGIVNAVTDVVILCLPMPILWKLQLPKNQRLQLLGIFSLSGLVCVVSICRSCYIAQINSTDPSWADVNTVILSAIENCAGCLCASLPTLLPIWKSLRGQKVHDSRTRTTARTMSYSAGAHVRRGETDVAWILNSEHDLGDLDSSGASFHSHEAIKDIGNHNHSIKVTKATTVESKPREPASVRRPIRAVHNPFSIGVHKASVSTATKNRI